MKKGAVIDSSFLRGTKMVTNNVMNMLHNAIQVFDKRCGMCYLLIFGAKGKYQFIQIQIKQTHFWHLLGCKLKPDSNEGKRNTYIACKNKEDICDRIVSQHGYSEIKEKYIAMQNVFDFVEKASQIRIGYAVHCPEQYQFQIGTGNAQGVIGYGYSNAGSSAYLLPKSAQLKALSKVTRTTFRIFVILSKKTGRCGAAKIEYEIKNGVYKEIKACVPEGLNAQFYVK